MNEKSIIQPTMLLISSVFDNGNGDFTPNFRMIPVDLKCPYVECIFVPKYLSLMVATKTTKTQMMMIEKLDDNGFRIPIKNSTKELYKMTRKELKTFHDFRLIGKDEIEQFIRMFSINAESFDYAKYFVIPDSPEKSKIITNIESTDSTIITPPKIEVVSR